MCFQIKNLSYCKKGLASALCTGSCNYADSTIQSITLRALHINFGIQIFSVKINVTASYHQIYCTEHQIVHYIYCFSYGDSCTLFLKYPVKCTLLLHSAAQKFTNMLFLGLSFKICKFRVSINRCCASCKANLQDYQMLLISKGLCDSDKTQAECYENELLRKWTLKRMK